jgi:uncharacterized protein YcfJ
MGVTIGGRRSDGMVGYSVLLNTNSKEGETMEEVPTKQYPLENSGICYLQKLHIMLHG